MDVLLDTHVLLWAWAGDKRLSKADRELLAATDVRAHVSIVSVWEIAIKSSLGKLELRAPLEELVDSFPEFRFHLLPLRLEHVNAVRALPLHHRDPFDRMLIAQAKCEGMHLLTADPLFSGYDVPLIGA